MVYKEDVGRLTCRDPIPARQCLWTRPSRLPSGGRLLSTKHRMPLPSLEGHAPAHPTLHAPARRTLHAPARPMLSLQPSLFFAKPLVAACLFSPCGCHAHRRTLPIHPHLLSLAPAAVMFFAASEARRHNKYRYPAGKERLEPLGVVVFSIVMGTAAVSVIIQGIKVGRCVDNTC